MAMIQLKRAGPAQARRDLSGDQRRGNRRALDPGRGVIAREHPEVVQGAGT